MTNEPDVELENLIDRLGLAPLIVAISETCDEKAEHLREAWQDEDAALQWELDAALLYKAAQRLRSHY